MRQKPKNEFSVEPPENNKFVEWRMRKMLEFLDGEEVYTPVLDIGSRSQATKILDKYYICKIDSTIDCDFNFSFKAPRYKYGMIFCLEVLEHLMNPLSFMKRLRNTLHNQGMVVLSTPSRKPWIEKMHFTEYSRKSLDILFKESGFVVEKYKLVHTMPLWWHLTGVRPFLRLFVHHYHFYILMKPGDKP